MSKKRLPRAIEKSIFERDEHICKICGKETPFDEGTVDHKLPSSLGGTDHPSNLQWACWRCNNLKGNTRTDDEVRELLGIPRHTFNVKWNLTGIVMPDPPYGLGDIPDSDSLSELIVHQLEREGEVKIICDMKGLRPNARYRLFIANAYTPYSTWPGRFSDTIPPLSFWTNNEGSGTREFNLHTLDFPTSGVHSLSVWLNELDSNRTCLISNNFEVII